MFAKKHFTNIDWILFLSTLPLLAAGLLTMRSLGAVENANYFFYRQLVWMGISFLLFFAFSFIDWRFLRRGELLLAFLLASLLVLAALLTVGKVVRGASSWIKLPFFSVEPAEIIKLLLILILAKYFSRRHIEIANIKHIIVSGFYMAVPALLVFLQPDFGSAAILFLIWFGMIMVSGVSKKHLFMVFALGLITLSVCWLFVFRPYQKDRILSFFNPLKDVQRSSYNARQSVIAVGSGRIWGKGIGFGTQSRLEFLPEHQTDFIFAAFAEEWGLIGGLFVFLFYGIIFWRILKNAFVGQTNFETLFGFGLAVLLGAHFVINVGMNIGILPITGVSLPFLSYGGSNLVMLFSGLGMLMGMRRYSRQVHPEDAGAEFLGPR